jgi:ATP-dependent helicase/nuclease subunit B
MNRLADFLLEFCRRRPLDEKVCVVPSFSAAHGLGEALAREDGAWVNLRLTTPTALAEEAAGLELAADGLRLLSREELQELVGGILSGLKAEGRLSYFGRLEPTPALAGLVLGALEELRLAGLRSARLDPGSFVVREKGREVKLILERFEGALATGRWLDRAGLYELARQVLGGGRDRVPGRNPAAWCIVVEGMPVSLMEKEFLYARAGERLVLAPRDPVYGLAPVPEPLRLPLTRELGPARKERAGEEPSFPGSVPEWLAEQSDLPAADCERLSWLFAPGSAPPPFGDGTVAMFRAVGRTNECREVLRRLIAEKTPLDSAEIIHPPGLEYPFILHLLGRRLGLRLSFASGLPVALTSTGRALYGLLEWVEQDFPARKLGELLASGDLRCPADDGGAPAAAAKLSRLLDEAGIGWGRDRYEARLAALREEYSDKASRRQDRDGDEEDAGSAEAARRAVSEIEVLSRFVAGILRSLPRIEEGRRTDFSAFCAGLRRVISEHGRVSSGSGGEADDLDREAAGKILRYLDLLASSDGPLGSGGRDALVPLADVIRRLRTGLSGIAVGRSSPLPGAVHVASFGSAGWSHRPNVFCVGLDEQSLPGRVRPDPVLLDEEREALSPFLMKSAEKLRSGLVEAAGLLGSLRGRVVLSYSAYDMQEERPRFPSSVLLQALRLMEGRPDLDYSALERWFQETGREAAGFVPEDETKSLDDIDWWLARLVRDGRILDGSAYLAKWFPGLKEGVAASAARAGPLVTEYEGVVIADPARYDPSRNHRLVLSATTLESLADCPFAYFLKKVLGVQPPETVEYDPAVWLDPKQRGSLVHEILCEFMTAVTEKKEKVSAVRHREALRAVAEKRIEAYAEEIPPPSPVVFDLERAGILESLDIFLRLEEEREKAVEPLAFEKRFDRARLELPGGRHFLLSGVIDRIDRAGRDLFEVVDYKTGSYYKYEGLKAFGGGRCLQPALYAVTAEQCLRKEGLSEAPRVRRSGYLFPTRKGEGRAVMIGEFDRDELRRLLADLLEVVRRGWFVPSPFDPDKGCEFCDYAEVCGETAKTVKGKRELAPEIFELLDRIRSYE